MDAKLFQKFNPEEYYRHFLADGLRPDGRGLRESRAAELEKGVLSSTKGSASIRIGQSAALAGVRAELAEAAPDQPALGRLEIAVELPAMASPGFREKQRTLGLSTNLSNTLTNVFNTVQVFDPTQLAVREGLSWLIRVHVVCLNFDGNAFDLCLLASLAALENTSLPGLVEPDPSSGLLQEAAPDAPETSLVTNARKLRLTSRPLPVTLARLPGGNWVLDPCAAEEDLGASVSLCLVAGHWLVFHQGGGADANSFLEELMPVARTCVDRLTALLDS